MLVRRKSARKPSERKKTCKAKNQELYESSSNGEGDVYIQ